MARVKFGVAVASIDGSIGGSTFQRSGYGYSLRNKPSQRSSGTAAQNSRRTALSVVLSAWHNLSTSEKQLWDNFCAYRQQQSRYNNNAYLSGYALFMKYNLLRYQFVGSILTELSYADPLIESHTPTLFIDSGNLTYNSGVTELNLSMIIGLFMSNVNRTPGAFKTKQLRFIQATYMTTYNVNLTVAYENVYGSIPVEGDSVLLNEVLIGAFMPLVGCGFQGLLNVTA